jgi:hypothetical protein
MKTKAKTNTNGEMVSLISDPIDAVIAQATTASDRGALRFVVDLVTKTKPAKRPEIWRHFARSMGKRVSFLIEPLQKAFEEIERSNIDPRSDAFNARAYGEHVEQAKSAPAK